MNEEPVYREDDHELLGFIRQSREEHEWLPLTLFKIPLGKLSSKETAISIVRDKGLQSLTEHWEFFDKADNEWHLCTLLEANHEKVTIKEGYYSFGDGKVVEIVHPDDSVLRMH